MEFNKNQQKHVLAVVFGWKSIEQEWKMRPIKIVNDPKLVELHLVSKLCPGYFGRDYLSCSPLYDVYVTISSSFSL